MKSRKIGRIIILITFNVMISHFLTAQNFSESIDWINNKISNHKTEGDIFQKNGYYTIETVSHCKCELKKYHLNLNDIYSVTNTWKFSFSDINPNTIEMKSSSSDSNLFYWRLFTTNSKKSISQYTSDRDYPILNTFLGIGPYSESFIETDLKQRMLKALIHLTEICGGKKERF